MTTELSTRQISEAGKLLVQYKLQLEAVESERSTPGTKPHLVAAGASTIEVYSNREPKPAGRQGASGAGLDA
ncbi:MAG: hypothetical protein ACREOF_16785 [Gemmatimonadales bacterium]